ncbi:MAG: hypothetical protein WA821_11675 [Anaerolineales bacterium]
MSIPPSRPSEPESSTLSIQMRNARLRNYAQILVEWVIILVVAWLYASSTLLDLNPMLLQESGEQNESATFPILTEIGLSRYGQIPLWNPYALTGIPYVEDPLNHFWNPVSTLPIGLLGGINGMKVSVVLAFMLAGLGQWLFAHVFGARGLSRLWTALLFMLSGGVAFLWYYGWYELLMGVVWFPWCFAVLWWALRRRDWTSIILTAFCITMVLSTGGGYYPFYLLGSLGVLTILNLFWSAPSKRLTRLLRALAVALISAGLLAVVILPVLHGLSLFNRWTGDDREQSFSQPIPYALVNYVVYDRAWEGAEILGLPSGWKWFYIGAIALGAALCLAPLALVLNRPRRIPLIAAGVLTVAILAWVANRFSPVGYIYALFPFLYTLRFPNRLLIVATSPLLVVAGLGWQNLYRQASLWRLNHKPLSKSWGRAIQHISLGWWPNLVLVAIMAASVMDVFSVNQPVAFSTGALDQTLKTALTWLKDYDKSFYYVNLGGNQIYWKGTSVAYELEMPVINLDYGRRLFSMDRQLDPNSPFIASPKYIVALPNTSITLPENAQQINSFDGYNIWYLPDALPAAFSAAPDQLQAGTKLSKEMIAPAEMKYDGPNRVIASGQPAHPGDQLVALVSDYPGWELLVDGKPAPLLPVNGYLGAAMLPGYHTYTFDFRPFPYFLGLTISAITLLLALGLLLKEALVQPGRRPAQSS